ncbi:mitochondrial carrier domain-containing protein [Irpex rosettiformis]|uniref:Mitochondrial carrier domain-containing protein n=1 Tax=Irpex rosettiformis TaxID=378272 RepID=A0ACB8UBE8_9APHY|nr:mitochondrial carrier domain-containing protein [Irpex rosettiformis]
MSSEDEGGSVALDPRIDLFAGSIAGIAALTVGFPFDTVKVRLQNPEFASRYSSVWHAFTTIVREERIRGLFRGITSPLLTTAPLNGVVFAGYGALLKMQLNNATDEPRLSQITLAGIGTGIIASVVTSPTELIKIQQQSIRTPTGGIAPTVQQVALEIWRRRGIRGLFRGFTSTAIRETGYGAYFGVYEGTLRLLSKLPSYDDMDEGPVDHTSLHSEAASSKKHHSYPSLLLAGGLAGVASWVVTFPFDVVKTRVQSSMVTSADNPYRTTLSTIVNSYREEGFRVFFHGLKPTLIRAIPVNMVTFATFETVVRALT